DDRGHPAFATGAGALHLAATLADEPERLGEWHDPGRDEGAVLAHRMPGGESRRGGVDAEARPLLAQGGEIGDRGRQEGRLRVHGEVELLGRPLEREVADGLAERGVGFREDGRGGRRGGGEGLAHAHRLRTLAWEDER